jgi:hypothetical protein
MVHAELGEQLRRAREARGWSLEEVEKATAIRKRFLQAMEEGRLDALPGEIQLRGFLRNYANHVGLNGEDLLALYERRTRPVQVTAVPPSATPTRPIAPQSAPPQSARPQPAPTTVRPPTRPVVPSAPPAQPAVIQQTTAPQVVAPQLRPRPVAAPAPAARTGLTARLPTWLTIEMVLIALAVILVICVAVLFALLLTNPGNGTPAAAPRLGATKTRATPPLPPPTVPPETPVSTPQLNITASVKLTSTADFVQVMLAATEHVWVRVKTDGKTAFEGMFAPGQSLKWEAKELVIVETGNGAGLTASFNSKPVGALGPRDQLVARAWTPAGETVPPKPTPLPATPTATP